MWDLCCRCEITPVKDLLFQSPVSCTWVLRCPSWFVTVGGWLYAIWFVTLRCWEYTSWARRVSGYGHTPRIVAVFEELGTARLRRVRCRHHDTGFFYVFAKLGTAEPSSISFGFVTVVTAELVLLRHCGAGHGWVLRYPWLTFYSSDPRPL